MKITHPDFLIVVFLLRNGFPGAQPVSMDRQNINFIAEKRYKVSWKADGVR